MDRLPAAPKLSRIDGAIRSRTRMFFPLSPRERAGVRAILQAHFNTEFP